MENKTPQNIQQQLNKLVSSSILYEKEQVGWNILAKEIDKTCQIINKYFSEKKYNAII